MVIVTDSVFLNNASSRSFVVNEYITRKGIRNVSYKTAFDDCFYDEKTGLHRMKNAFFFNDDKIFVMDRHPDYQVENPQKCDYLIVRNSYYGNPEDYFAPFHDVGAVIVDGSNSRKMQQQWREAQDSLTVQIHLLPTQGAWKKRY